MGKITALKPSTLDPNQVTTRLYRQVDALLTQLETGDHITLKERVTALLAIGRLQQVFIALRKGSTDDNERKGSTVRKYAGAFAADAGGGRDKNAGPDLSEPEPDDWFETGGDDTRQ
jgi:hypothetical protein